MLQSVLRKLCDILRDFNAVLFADFDFLPVDDAVFPFLEIEFVIQVLGHTQSVIVFSLVLGAVIDVCDIFLALLFEEARNILSTSFFACLG